MATGQLRCGGEKAGQLQSGGGRMLRGLTRADTSLPSGCSRPMSILANMWGSTSCFGISRIYATPYLFRVGGHHVACDEASQVATARSLSRPRACPAPYARPMNARGTCAVGTVPSLSPCPQQSCRARARDPPPRYDTLNSNLKPTFWHCLPPALMPHGPLSAYTHTHTRTHTHTHRCG